MTRPTFHSHLCVSNTRTPRRATPNALLSYGENDGAIGELLGEEGQGLKYMFMMMNDSRIGVGLAATMCGWSGYAYSKAYAMGLWVTIFGLPVSG